jgi:5-hydroxyisourate hydrolase
VTDTLPTISTHVLDVEHGRPAVGVRVRLTRLVAGGEVTVGAATTDDDGRIADLLAGVPLEPGDYRLSFELDGGGFFRRLAVDIRVTDASRSYHVPLIRAPFALSTYRGS